MDVQSNRTRVHLYFTHSISGKYCIIYKDIYIIIILDVLLVKVKSGELTRIIQADPKVETLCTQNSFVVV